MRLAFLVFHPLHSFVSHQEFLTVFFPPPYLNGFLFVGFWEVKYDSESAQGCLIKNNNIDQLLDDIPAPNLIFPVQLDTTFSSEIEQHST